VTYYISLPFFSLALIVSQMMIGDIVFSGKIAVELSLIVVIYAGFRFDVLRGGILSFILGFIHDCLTCSLSGLYTLIYVLIFLISKLASLRISPGKPFLIMSFTFVCALFEGMMVILFHPLLYGGGISTHTITSYLPQVLIVSTLSPILFRVFHWTEAVLNGRESQPVKRT
jgi:rod shape-determining protein MreD